MVKESWKVFWACLIGAGLGTFVAMEFGHYFWWVGLLVGGFAGYLSYEWRKVLAAIPAAYRAAQGVQITFPPKQYWVFTWWAVLVMCSLWFHIAILLSFFAVLQGDEAEGYFRMFGMCQLLSLLGATTILPLVAIGHYHNESELQDARNAVYLFFPPLTYFYHLPCGLIWIARCVPKAVKAVGQCLLPFVSFLKCFAWELFLRIHSEMRLLCGVDSFLGAGVGYFAGSVLVGALSGAAFGLVNYVVVTKGWLEPKGYLPITIK